MSKDLAQSKSHVLYIGGRGRSGSTLLGNTLNEVNGFFHIGEIPRIWEKGYQQNRLCGCGVPFKKCPVWSEISSQAFGGEDAINPSHMKTLRQKAPRNRQLPFHLLDPQSSDEAVHSEYLSALKSLYSSTQEVTNCDVIVDSSKFPSQAFLLTQLPSVHLTMVHLVRDPRGTAYSWQKKARRTDIDAESTVHMKQHSPSLEAYRWTSWNMLIEAIGNFRASEYIRVRYEDFISSPQSEFDRIGRCLGLDMPEIFEGGSVRLNGNHTVWGNPSRMEKGPITLRLDDEWRTELALSDRLTVSALTWPLLLRYGYFT